MNKERIKNGFAVALSALVCAGVVGSVAYLGIKSNKKDEAQAVLNVPLKASYVQTLYAPGENEDGENWKVRMNESAFKFGQNGYCVFGSGDTAEESLLAYERQGVSAVMPVYSNLYTEYRAAKNSYNSVTEKIRVDGLRTGGSRNANGWTKIQGSDKQYLATAEDLQCPISRWAICASYADSVKGSDKGRLLDAQGKKMYSAPAFYGYAEADKYYGQTSVLIDKTIVNDMYLTMYVYAAANAAYQFKTVNTFVSVYGYGIDQTPDFENKMKNFETNDYIKDLSTIYDGEYLSSTKMTGSATGAYVTFRLSGVGKFRLVTGRTTENAWYPQFGGFFLDTIK